MKHGKIFILFTLLIGLSFTSQQNDVLPEGFVYVKDVIPDIDIELRYYSSNNFVGDTINGYNSNVLILTKAAAEALSKVQDDLHQKNLCLRVYDGYRPQRAVNHFMAWAKDLNDTIRKHQFYPDVEKRHLFREEYIATRSGHSRGSTVDLTIIDGTTNEPLDMGSPFDFFGKESWVAHPDLSEQQKANRQLLQKVMLKHNFRNYPKEWWHFTLRWEPFPKTYFDFEIE
ncbi:M15 family metallopeptidase [Psychroserpens sp.]|uniref:M15 family metallopeptidase n=1 Tax=Psychroserpens sp. TaxID=2020870 RepID=UPI001AFE3362|nr:M15 family metallopeptidase [Psychroserpens sp.]MBO6606064.1 M15 family metallopeptidase [Psychroserpens sp.]MBO6630352.1 M15 family metallopeptidase [Psychroserpens sp.]MBO6652565.1 M15 family metallopeptidase [Psychroserpens sp.]MBO6681663.1 M15 family metallopeptidase [Psychroserpens sp.]MBO6749438.1 M15 family metallopeptidase [Psychroserpens sp.]